MSITFPAGFRAAGMSAGLKVSGKPDLALIVRDGPEGPGAGSAACFTRNLVLGAPVMIARQRRGEILAGAPPWRAVLVNSGNANAATGQRGLDDARACARAVGAALGIDPAAVMPSSTGVIGRLMPVERIVGAVPALAARLERSDRADADAARAIMTTDLVPKTSHREATIGGVSVRVGAIAKGSGMIAPMLDSAAAPPTPSATMLAFVTTDAPVDAPSLQVALDRVADASFNCISVDNHPSCSDTVMVMSSGQAGGQPLRPGSAAFERFADLLGQVCHDLARQIVVDGEGASRIFVVRVSGTGTGEQARAVAERIVNSPLVKCAIHGRDPNWGRIVTAAGNAGVPFDPAQASLKIGPVEVYRAGVPIGEALKDPELARAMGSAEVSVELTLGAGPGRAHMIGCDLSDRYVHINADYTT